MLFIYRLTRRGRLEVAHPVSLPVKTVKKQHIRPSVRNVSDNVSGHPAINNSLDEYNLNNILGDARLYSLSHNPTPFRPPQKMTLLIS
jgi:hypothetical protein